MNFCTFVSGDTFSSNVPVLTSLYMKQGQTQASLQFK